MPVYNDWPEDFPPVTSLVPYAALRHNPDPEIAALYDRAKNHEDTIAAAELINKLFLNEGAETIRQKIESLSSRNPNAIIVHVHAVEGQGKNKIPLALAEFMGEISGLAIARSIVQADVVSKTGVKNTWYRMAHRPQFDGQVQSGREYILVDDVFSAGGTFSELRTYIESNGGKVVNAITMANGSKSMNPQLGVTKQHILELENKYGVESMQQFLQEESLYAGNHKALTDSEARTILGAATLDEARNRITEARYEGIRRNSPEVVQRTSLPNEVNSPQNTALNRNSTNTILSSLHEPDRSGELPSGTRRQAVSGIIDDYLEKNSIREVDGTVKINNLSELNRQLNAEKPFFGDIMKFAFENDRLPTDAEIAQMPRQGWTQEQIDEWRKINPQVETIELDKVLIQRANNSSNAFDLGSSIARQYTKNIEEIKSMNSVQDKDTVLKKLHELTTVELASRGNAVGAYAYGPARLNKNDDKNFNKAARDAANVDAYMKSLREAESKMKTQSRKDDLVAKIREAEAQGLTEITVEGKTFYKQRKNWTTKSPEKTHAKEQAMADEFDPKQQTETDLMNEYKDYALEEIYGQGLSVSNKEQAIPTPMRPMNADEVLRGKPLSSFISSDIRLGPKEFALYESPQQIILFDPQTQEGISLISNAGDFTERDRKTLLAEMVDIFKEYTQVETKDIALMFEYPAFNLRLEEFDLSQQRTNAVSHEAANNTKEQVMSDVQEGTRDLMQEAFLNAVHQRKVVAEALKNGSLACLPGAEGLADTEPAVNLVNGTYYHGANMLYLKEFAKQNEFPTAEYITASQMEKAHEDNPDIAIRKGQHGVSIYIKEQKEGQEEPETKHIRLFNVAQATKPWELKTWAEQQQQKEVQEKIEFMEKQYGKNYTPPEQKARTPNPPVVTCSSTEPEKYLGQYLAAVSMGSQFKASPEQSKEFAQKMENALFEKVGVSQKTGNEVTNPFSLSKISNAASSYCKQFMSELKQELKKQNQFQKPEQEQKQEHKQSRGR